METLKNIVEKGHFAHGKINALELVADFTQDTDEKWYFLNLVNYKTELAVQRKLNPASFGLLMDRLSKRSIRSAYKRNHILTSDMHGSSSPMQKTEPKINIIKTRPYSAGKASKGPGFHLQDKPNTLNLPSFSVSNLNSFTMNSSCNSSSGNLYVPIFDETRHTSTSSLAKEIIKDLKSLSTNNGKKRYKGRSRTLNSAQCKLK